MLHTSYRSASARLRVLTRLPRVSMYLCLGELLEAQRCINPGVLSCSPLLHLLLLSLPFGGTPPPRRPGLSD